MNGFSKFLGSDILKNVLLLLILLVLSLPYIKPHLGLKEIPQDAAKVVVVNPIKVDPKSFVNVSVRNDAVPVEIQNSSIPVDINDTVGVEVKNSVEIDDSSPIRIYDLTIRP